MTFWHGSGGVSRDARANNDDALAARLADESATTTAEVRHRIKETHDQYWLTMTRLKEAYEEANGMTGFTDAEQRRLNRFAEWEERERAIREELQTETAAPTTRTHEIAPTCCCACCLSLR